MIGKIADVELLKETALELAHDKFKPGFDGMDAKAAVIWMQINCDVLSRKIYTGTYKPSLSIPELMRPN